MKNQKNYVLRIIAILICAFATNILTIGITKTYSAFNESKSVQVKADVPTENQMFNVDIKYKVFENNKWVPYSCRVIGENITYNPNNPITNPVQIVVSPTSYNQTGKESISQIIYFEVQENLQEYMLHINPIKFNGETVHTYININTRTRQAIDLRNLPEYYTTGYLKIKYLNGVIDKSINIQFENKELIDRLTSNSTYQWYDVVIPK